MKPAASDPHCTRNTILQPGRARRSRPFRATFLPGIRRPFLRVIRGMKTRFLCALLTLLALSGFPAAGTARQDDAANRTPYRQLTWADFKVDDAIAGMSAQTQTFLSFRYSSQARRVHSSLYEATTGDVTFEGGFDRAKSWRRSRIPADNVSLLVHEQGHLDINQIHLRRLKALPVAAFPRGSGVTPRAALDDLNKKMKTFHENGVREMQEEQRRYDEETNHGVKRDIQRQWTQRLRRELDAS